MFFRKLRLSQMHSGQNAVSSKSGPFKFVKSPSEKNIEKDVQCSRCHEYGHLFGLARAKFVDGYRIWSSKTDVVEETGNYDSPLVIDKTSRPIRSGTPPQRYSPTCHNTQSSSYQRDSRSPMSDTIMTKSCVSDVSANSSKSGIFNFIKSPSGDNVKNNVQCVWCHGKNHKFGENCEKFMKAYKKYSIGNDLGIHFKYF
ncbi:Hypothetical protein CINCED_3A005594 [Cinara cedri]|uniref:Uncharacterized protein n=1 Tax=Cinara cedri TaxID=506608 RepID=A0A5E4MAR7_9HEMI|nr:Hypothetical protein CINCED_3A005594 [Cinara cedri]